MARVAMTPAEAEARIKACAFSRVAASPRSTSTLSSLDFIGNEKPGGPALPDPPGVFIQRRSSEGRVEGAAVE